MLLVWEPQCEKHWFTPSSPEVVLILHEMDQTKLRYRMAPFPSAVSLVLILPLKAILWREETLADK